MLYQHTLDGVTSPLQLSD